MELLIAFGTDDGKELTKNHVGQANWFYVYKFSDGIEKFIERRENVKYKEDDSIKHGDPQKAKVTSSVLLGIDVVVGSRFGPNILRLLKKFVCVVVRTNVIIDAIKIIHNNMDKIVEENNKGENRKQIVLKQ
jgi:predicted Fe-Mo cluster-binding NifX family protein